MSLPGSGFFLIFWGRGTLIGVYICGGVLLWKR